MTAITSRLTKLEQNIDTGEDEIILLYRPPEGTPHTARAWKEHERMKEKHKDRRNVVCLDWEDQDL